jgi:hypothetical protein
MSPRCGVILILPMGTKVVIFAQWTCLLGMSIGSLAQHTSSGRH